LIFNLAKELLEMIRMTALLLDAIHQNNDYGKSVEAQFLKVKDLSLTPSAMIVEALETSGLEYHQWILKKSREHKAALGTLHSSTTPYRELAKHSALSLDNQRQLEANDDVVDFDQFLKRYLTLPEELIPSSFQQNS
jgi:glutamate--cysteine ligase